jgi:hypothetical protein
MVSRGFRACHRSEMRVALTRISLHESIAACGSDSPLCTILLCVPPADTGRVLLWLAYLALADRLMLCHQTVGGTSVRVFYRNRTSCSGSRAKYLRNCVDFVDIQDAVSSTLIAIRVASVIQCGWRAAISMHKYSYIGMTMLLSGHRQLAR